MSAKNVLNVVGCLFLLMFALQAFTTVKANRELVWKAIRKMLMVSLGGAKALLLIGGIIGLAYPIFQLLLSDWIPPFPPLFTIGVSLLALNGACLPPTFLFLAASQGAGFSLAHEIDLRRIGWTVLFGCVGNIFRFLELKMLSIAAAAPR
ncbi:MAG: hypothetical protein A2Y62_03535 [Candidatus Fischerbacteria bacterium RBG_13_37_8]|uniref:Uncharacterized protein n=1 Tax=Candidatus Fischerbacteria bacterium RBG_13_37_8 TaxID=1817863 RepID=A0A1F5VK98_9BACT|nr:MAG: hypothetical protein A2Y62_03535 [Candidatus Fischerbacteria bacterium RBG_13_37_8]